MTSSPRRPRPAVGADSAIRNYPQLLHRMERLMEIGQNLASTLDLPRLLAQVAEAARELTDTETASVLLLEPRTGKLRFEAATNFDPSATPGLVVPIEGSIAGWIVAHSEPVLVPDVHADARWHSSVDEVTAFATRSILGVPLVARDNTIGVLEAINKRGGSFTEDDATTLQWLAAQAAVAIVNARLFEQSDLISEMVHELRTPLTALMATSQLLGRPELPEAQRNELAHVMQHETRRLSDLATNYLDMARLESGRVRFAVERFDLPALIEECCRVVQPQAAEFGVELKTRVAGSLPPLASDRGKLKQVLLNLLTNAIKYNRHGGEVRIEAGNVGARARVTVSDNGRGIPPDAMPHLFEPWFRVANGEGYVPGTGLGLRIARGIVQALGGDMGVKSELGRGSTFHFTLPFEEHKTDGRG